jgi:hypothetical protein
MLGRFCTKKCVNVVLDGCHVTDAVSATVYNTI